MDSAAFPSLIPPMTLCLWILAMSGQPALAEQRSAAPRDVAMTTNYTLDNANQVLSQSLHNTGWFIVGDTQAAQLDFDNGVSVTTTPQPGKIGAILGSQAGSQGVVYMSPRYGNYMDPVAKEYWQIGGSLVVGQFGTGGFQSQGIVTVGGDFDIGERGTANGEVYLGAGAKLSVQGVTQIGVDPSTTGFLSVKAGYAAHTSFTYGSELHVGVQGSATMTIFGDSTVGPTPGHGAGTIVIGSRAGPTASSTCNTLEVGERNGKGATLTGGKLIILPGTYYCSYIQPANVVAIGNGGLVSLSEGLTIDDNAIVYMAGGTLDTPSVTFSGSGQVIGLGVINAPIGDGSVTAGGYVDVHGEHSFIGSLTLNGAVMGGHAVLTVDGSRLILNNAVGGAVQVVFGPNPRGPYKYNAIQLADPATMHGVIGGFAADDSIDLVNRAVVTHAYHDHGDGTGALALNFSDGSFAQLNFVGTYAATMFHVIADGAGGTRVYLRQG